MRDTPFKRVVVCAANRYGELIVCGARHYDMVMHSQLKQMKEDKLFAFEQAGRAEQGFIDNRGQFLTREEALILATEAGQLVGRIKTGNPDSKELFSEDLY